MRLGARDLRPQRRHLRSEAAGDRRALHPPALDLFRDRGQQRPNEVRLAAAAEELPHVVLQSVCVLLQEVGRSVHDIAGVVPDPEGVGDGALGLDEEWVLRCPCLLREASVGAQFEVCLAVEQLNQPPLALDEVHAGLVVGVFGDGQGNALTLALRSILHKSVLVVVILQGLVGVVDAHLLEGVRFEVLEAKNIQQTDVFGLLAAHRLSPDDLVQFAD
mmetsp:Transcript_41354/g.69616  ORF Transcript_41354/g.69616 Transcript_41354/m.69616 type:complete len:218 (+) Transcript_41354:1003-1656(+)